jgi:hypothetical protein
VLLPLVYVEKERETERGAARGVEREREMERSATPYIYQAPSSYTCFHKKRACGCLFNNIPFDRVAPLTHVMPSD